MGQFHPGGRKGKKGKWFRSRWEIPRGSSDPGGAQRRSGAFSPSGIWYGEKHRVTDWPPELTSQDLGSTSRILACLPCHLGQIFIVSVSKKGSMETEKMEARDHLNVPKRCYGNLKMQ